LRGHFAAGNERRREGRDEKEIGSKEAEETGENISGNKFLITALTACQTHSEAVVPTSVDSLPSRNTCERSVVLKLLSAV